MPAVLAILAAAAFAAACNNGSATPVSPTPAASTTPQTATETFTGSLAPNGASTFPFASQAGTVTETLTSLGNNSTIAIGMSLGTWDGTSCTVGVSNDSATVSTALSGTLAAAGNLCARVYDVGNVTGPTPFTVTIVHP